MTEDFLHYIWQYKLFDRVNLQTTQGEALEILHIGTHNTDSGPDFSHARIKIGETVLAGHVEIHVNSSDWLKHNHQTDPAYTNVILHVVYEHDATNEENDSIYKPTLELKHRIKANQWEIYHNWLESKREIPCGQALARIKPIRIKFWLERMFIERLSHKVERIQALMQETGNNKEEVAYRLFMRYFGGTVNAAAFERLSQLLPYKTLMKHRNQLVVMEALLFGVAGFLSQPSSEEYVQALQEHFKFYKDKYRLSTMQSSEWKMMRMRPVSFPGHRLAQAAAFMQKVFPLYSFLVNMNSSQSLFEQLQVPLSSYWKKNYHFNTPAQKVIETVGKSFSYNLCINVVIPLMYFEGNWLGNDELKDKAIQLATTLSAENNKYIRLFNELGISAQDASESQALLHLYQQYCTPKKCLSCAFGHDILNE